MNNSKFLAFLLAFLMIISAAACGCLGGGSGGEAKVQSTTRTTTLGQELQDLDAAHKKGIISDEDYEKKKAELLERND
jgi:hypothetical protein